MTVDSTWTDRAACRNHPSLPPDAWHEVRNRQPVGLGVEALAVCRYRCSVRKECLEATESARTNETIAGGSWWDHEGKKHDGQIPLHVDGRWAAAYLGVTQKYLYGLAKTGSITSCNKPNAKYRFRRKEILRVLNKVQWPHGTVEQYRGHILRGEVPCVMCLPMRAAAIADAKKKLAPA